MGMNYYFVEGEKRLHIGKSSSGWYFLMHIYPHIPNWDAWQNYIIQHRKGRIVCESGNECSLDQLTEQVEERKGDDADILTLTLMDQMEKEQIEMDPQTHLFRTHSNIYTQKREGTWEYVNYDFC
jgi:hypothetical protein